MGGVPAVVEGHREDRGAFAQQAGGIAGGVLEDLAAGRVGGIAGDAGDRHGLRVDESRMAAGVGQQHGVVRRYAIERGVQREAFHVRVGRVVPLALVPAAAHDPIARFDLAGGAAHLGDDFIPGTGFA